MWRGVLCLFFLFCSALFLLFFALLCSSCYIERYEGSSTASVLCSLLLRLLSLCSSVVLVSYCRFVALSVAPTLFIIHAGSTVGQLQWPSRTKICLRKLNLPHQVVFFTSRLLLTQFPRDWDSFL